MNTDLIRKALEASGYTLVRDEEARFGNGSHLWTFDGPCIGHCLDVHFIAGTDEEEAWGHTVKYTIIPALIAAAFVELEIIVREVRKGEFLALNNGYAVTDIHSSKLEAMCAAILAARESA